MLQFVAVLAVFFVAGGAPPPQVNETQYLAKAKHAWDASYCPGDFFLDTVDAHASFYWCVGWVTRLCSLEATAWVGRLAAWALLAVGWLQLCGATLRRRGDGAAAIDVLACSVSAGLFALLVDRMNFAGEWVVGGVEGKSFAYGFLLLGLADLAAGRWAEGNWRAVWPWLGAASALHVLVGGWAVVAAVGVIATDPLRRSVLTRATALGLAVGGVLSLAGLGPAMALQRGVDRATADEAARIYVFERLPHHLAPLSMPAEELREKAMRFAGLVLVMGGLWYAMRMKRSPDARIARQRPSAESSTSVDATGLERIFRFAALSLGIAAVGLAVEACLESGSPAAARILRFYWFRQADVAVPLAVALACGRLVLNWLPSSDWRRRLATLAPSAWVAWKLTVLAWGRYADPAPPALIKMEQPADWIAACHWIRDHAPADAVALVPRHAQSFKWYASRADVANWKDVPQDAAGIVAWKSRCDDLFPLVKEGKEPRLLAYPGQHTPRRLAQLAEQYGATYAVTSADYPLPWRQVYPGGDSSEGAAASHYLIYETPR
jgi:hypothetical protein